MERVEVRIGVAFIRGLIKVVGIPSSGQAPDITVIAEFDRRKISTAVGGCGSESRPYCLMVPAGKWYVRAEAGPIISERKLITLQAGTEQEIDFYFG